MSSRIYFVAGEASGDTHGAALLGALREQNPALEFLGRGGPRMKKIAGADFIDWSEHSAVLGLWEVLKQYGYFRAQFHETVAQIIRAKADAVVLIDYPGFNLRLARALHAKLPALKLIYYISPQVWAWNRQRIPQMAKYLDLMLCIFPFEAELYNQSGLRTIFVGHPMVEALGPARTNQERSANLIGIFPGSRRREIRKIFPLMLRAAQLIRAEIPDACFEVAAASPALAEEMAKLPNESMRITIGQANSLMQRAAAGMVSSGTATLEAAFFRLPFVLVYRVAWLTYLAARAVVKIKHLGMPNVLAGREVVPEFIQHRAQPEKIAAAVIRLLKDARARAGMLAEFERIGASLGAEGASKNAARAIVNEITR